MSPWKIVLLTLFSTACAVTSHSVRPSALGTARRSADMLAVVDVPGPLDLETVNSADWQVPLSGLVNLDNPKAKAAQLKDRDEPIQVFFHVIRHPTKGMFIVDTGIEKALRDDPDHSAPSGLLKHYMHLEKLVVHAPLGEWLAQHPQPLQGVMLTHMHIDHVGGMPDVPHGTPIYIGPGEASASDADTHAHRPCRRDARCSARHAHLHRPGRGLGERISQHVRSWHDGP
jgi:N-acyl homoserine lactone hydrolase